MLSLVDLDALRRPQPEPALGRHAAARGDRPSPGLRARPPAHGRTVRGARRDDPRADELRGAPDLGADRDDDRVRDPLDPGGGLPVVAGRGHERSPGPDHEDRRHRPAPPAIRGHPRGPALLRTRHRGPRDPPPSRRCATVPRASRRPRARWPRASSGECRHGRPRRRRRGGARPRSGPGASRGGGHPRAGRRLRRGDPALGIRPRRPRHPGLHPAQALADLRRAPGALEPGLRDLAVGPGDPVRGGRRIHHRDRRRRARRVRLGPVAVGARAPCCPSRSRPGRSRSSPSRRS